MNKKAFFPVLASASILYFCLVAVGQHSGGKSRPEPRFNASARLSNGIHVAFASQTEPANSIQFQSSYIETEGSEGIHRVFIDKESGLFFGYDVKVEPVPNTNQIKISVLPMTEDYERRLRERAVFKFRSVNSEFRSPSLFQTQAEQLVNEGDLLVMDALVNQRTGVKIVEIIKASFEEIPLGGHTKRSAEDPVRDFSLSDVEMKVINYRLLVNGELVAGFGPTGGCAGAIMWFYLPERGRFIFSIRPIEGYNFQKIGTIEDNKLSFSVGAEQYQWISSTPVLSTNGKFNLWVLHDANYRPELDEHVAAITRENARSSSRPNANEPLRPGLLMGAADRIEFLFPRK